MHLFQFHLAERGLKWNCWFHSFVDNSEEILTTSHLFSAKTQAIALPNDRVWLFKGNWHTWCTVVVDQQVVHNRRCTALHDASSIGYFTVILMIALWYQKFPVPRTVLFNTFWAVVVDVRDATVRLARLVELTIVGVRYLESAFHMSVSRLLMQW